MKNTMDVLSFVLPIILIFILMFGVYVGLSYGTYFIYFKLHSIWNLPPVKSVYFFIFYGIMAIIYFIYMNLQGA